MQVHRKIADCRAAVRAMQASGLRVGFVPTMGALHAGHVSLIQAALGNCDRVAVSIFVNPTQFGPNEDFAAYPRPLEADLAICRAEGVEVVFAPTPEEMYPASEPPAPDRGQSVPKAAAHVPSEPRAQAMGALQSPTPGPSVPQAEARGTPATTIHVAGLSDGLCGPFRPGHFDGVATVVAKLFNIVPADAAFFGEKDYQQLAVIRRMVADLNMPIEIVGCPTVREPDGLAMSSRNVYLSPAERIQAVSISRGLYAAVERAKSGERDPVALCGLVRQSIESAGPAKIEYIELVDADSLAPLAQLDHAARLCVAARIGKTRLIDNVAIARPVG